MGGLVSGIFDLMQGDPTKKEQDRFDSLGNYETGVGQSLTTAGAGYEENILSGDPTRLAQSLSPEISSGQKQVEQQRLTNANFGTRSGGTAASTNAAESAERGNIINLEGGLQSGTASSAVSQGSNLLGEASSNYGNEAQLASANQKRMTSDVGGIANGAGEIASDIFTGGATSVADGDAGGAIESGEYGGGGGIMEMSGGW